MRPITKHGNRRGDEEKIANGLLPRFCWRTEADPEKYNSLMRTVAAAVINMTALPRLQLIFGSPGLYTPMGLCPSLEYHLETPSISKNMQFQLGLHGEEGTTATSEPAIWFAESVGEPTLWLQDCHIYDPIAWGGTGRLSSLSRPWAIPTDIEAAWSQLVKDGERIHKICRRTLLPSELQATSGIESDR